MSRINPLQMDPTHSKVDRAFLQDSFTGFHRSDQESLDIKRWSEQSRIDTAFDMMALVERYKEILNQCTTMNDWIMVVEDLSPRSTSEIVPMKKRYYQFKGMIWSVGDGVESEELKPGRYIVWGLYNGQQVELVNDQPGELRTWFVREMRVLGIVDQDTKLTE